MTNHAENIDEAVVPHGEPDLKALVRVLARVVARDWLSKKRIAAGIREATKTEQSEQADGVNESHRPTAATSSQRR
jgi:hypothetical protein